MAPIASCISDLPPLLGLRSEALQSACECYTRSENSITTDPPLAGNLGQHLKEINMSLVSTFEEKNISLDNTSHPGRPGLDELVPSRYALKVGAIDVMVVSDGVLSLPGAMLGHNVDPAIRTAWLKDMFLPPDVLEWA